MKRILILEPYFGGSHRQFLLGLRSVVEGDYTFLTLPARKWKMRMQLSSPWFIEKIKEMNVSKRAFDVVLCSSFIDVAVFKALVQTIPGWNPKARILLYLHENQFAYPSRIKDPTYFQFTSINFNSVLSADAVAFNTKYNLQTFLAGCRKLLKNVADMKFEGVVDEIEAKSSILYPGVSLDQIIPSIMPRRAKDDDVPVILWNHRWEHDKNPQEFFNSLYKLKTKGVRFKVIVLGQSFDSEPECFVEAKRKLTEEIVHFGYLDDYHDYVAMLQKGDIVVSTAFHEFYGVAIIEAVKAGCYPLLPNRLSYPELFDDRHLYSEGRLAKELEKLIRYRQTLSITESHEMTRKFSWSELSEAYRQWLLEGEHIA